MGVEEFDIIKEYKHTDDIDEDASTKVGQVDMGLIPKDLQAIVRIMQGKEMGMEFEVKESPTFLGRDRLAMIPLSDARISRQHAAIYFQKHRFNLKDLGSTNGTFLNGAKITDAALKNGDMFQLGDTVCQFFVKMKQEPRGRTVGL
jgi:hypothetical protein